MFKANEILLIDLNRMYNILLRIILILYSKKNENRKKKGRYYY